jgi:hypothetical protein
MAGQISDLTIVIDLLNWFLHANMASLLSEGLRPTKWIDRNSALEAQEPLPSVADNAIASFFGFIIVDAMSYFSQHLRSLNESVRILQIATCRQRQKVDEQETQRQQNVHGKFEAHATLVAGKFLSSQVKTFESVTQKVTEIFRSVGGPRTPTQDSNESGTHG